MLGPMLYGMGHIVKESLWVSYCSFKKLVIKMQFFVRSYFTRKSVVAYRTNLMQSLLTLISDMISLAALWYKEVVVL